MTTVPTNKAGEVIIVKIADGWLAKIPKTLLAVKAAHLRGSSPTGKHGQAAGHFGGLATKRDNARLQKPRSELGESERNECNCS